MSTKRKKHSEILPECIQMFRRIDEKLDDLISRADRVNGRYEKHLEESNTYRKFVDQHERTLTLMEKERFNTSKNSQWRIAILVSIIMSVISVAARIVFG